MNIPRQLRMGFPVFFALGLLLAAASGQAADPAPETKPAGPQPAATGQHLDRPMATDSDREELRRLREELRQIKRELALLNQNLERPGVREIGAGIGYIFGLCGVAALVAARRNKGRNQARNGGH